MNFFMSGNLKIPFLDSTNLDVKWDGLNNGKFQKYNKNSKQRFISDTRK